MVKAILDGRKTQTRRVLKLKSRKLIKDGHAINPIDVLPMPSSKSPNQKEWVALTKENPNKGLVIKCSQGVPGDSLWVRETWQASTPDGYWWHEIPKEERELHNWALTNPVMPAYPVHPPRWIPSIHMPRWASRITLEVTGVRVERVQEISIEDCKAEGVGHDLNNIGWRYAFGSLWNSINEKRGFGWDINPFVWVIEFKVVDNA